MLSRIKKHCISLMLMAPDPIWGSIEHLLQKRLPPDYLRALCLERFGKHLLKHFDKVWKRAAENRKCMIISKGEWGSTYFNVAVMNNLISLSIYALYKGCIPVIKLHEDSVSDFKWDWYFSQFYDVMGTDITGFEEVPCDIVRAEFSPGMHMVYDPKGWQFQLFQMLFQRMIRLNQETHRYIEDEITAIGDLSKMLGVVLRGTDYIKLKPAGHPVQPKPEEIAEKTYELFNKGAYSAVYVATEEKKLYDLMANTVGIENVRENKREYYDELFYGNNEEKIGGVHFDRDNDNYWKGLEYLSSLIILSKCHSLVAGNCGATLFAMLMGNYHDPVIFNHGFY